MDYFYENGTLFRENRYESVSLITAGAKLDQSDFKSACIARAMEIHKQNPDIYLALSGGMQSQLCLRSFLEAGIKPNVLIIKFTNNSNVYDVDPAVNICKYSGIMPLIVEILPGHLYNIEGAKLIKKYQLYEFFDLIVAHIVEKLRIPLLLVDGIHIRRDVNPEQKWSLIVPENKLWVERFNLPNKKLIVNDFFTTPNVLTKFIYLPQIDSVLTNKSIGKISVVSSRLAAFKHAGFNGMDRYTLTDATYYLGSIRDKMTDKILKITGFDNRKFYIPIEKYLETTKTSEKHIWTHV